MNEKSYKRKFEFQEKMIARQSEQIEDLKAKIAKLELDLEEKDRIINSVKPLKDELSESIAQIRKYKKEYKELIKEHREMNKIINQEVYKGRWKLVKFLIK